MGGASRATPLKLASWNLITSTSRDWPSFSLILSQNCNALSEPSLAEGRIRILPVSLSLSVPSVSQVFSDNANPGIRNCDIPAGTSNCILPLDRGYPGSSVIIQLPRALCPLRNGTPNSSVFHLHKCRTCNCIER